MSAFPTEPISPRVFVEDTIPALFAQAELSDAERAMDLKVGLLLLDEEGGEPGGDWTLHFVSGELGITAGRSEECEVTIVQRVEDWRSALWEGRPGLIADAVAALAESGPEALRPVEGRGGVANPEAFRGLSEIQGLIEMIVSGDGEDWRVGVQIGPGPIQKTAQATIALGMEQADAIRRGELHPIEALITGQLRLEGDLGLIFQLQAVAMLAGMPKQPES